MKRSKKRTSERDRVVQSSCNVDDLGAEERLDALGQIARPLVHLPIAELAELHPAKGEELAIL